MKCKDAGQPVALRLFHPALNGLCLLRDSAAVLELDAFITAQVQPYRRTATSLYWHLLYSL
jgi:hypothetical protein